MLLVRFVCSTLSLLLPAQEVSQSGLRLPGERPMVSQPLRSPRAMVASVHELATQAGIDILHKGGNAIDAAVAVAFALGVVHPEAGNLGGSGYMLLRTKEGGVFAIDYAGTAPAAAKPGMFTSTREANVGYKAIAVPGTPAGFGLAHGRFGRLKWADCLEPARKLAQTGFPASQRLELILKLQVPVMKPFPETVQTFLHGGRPLQQGDLLIQRELAATITRMQRKGWREFYSGETARRIAAGVEANGGALSYDDLRGYEARLVEPLRVRYRDYTVLTMPPSSSGGVAVAVALNVLNQYAAKVGMEGSAASRHLQIEALRRGFAARTREFREGEGFVPQLLSDAYTREVTASLSLEKATSADDAAASTESPDTTHFTIVDGDGNIVTNTYTLSGFFGSQVMARGTGVLLNNHMSVFTNRAGSYNSIAPGRRYRSTMSPTLVLRGDGFPLLALGTPGAATIPSTIVQVVVNMIDYRMSLRDAIEFPRIHVSGAQVDAEPAAIVFDVAEKLKLMGHRLNSHLRSQGDVSAIAIEETGGWRVGWADGRRGGIVKGY